MVKFIPPTQEQREKALSGDDVSPQIYNLTSSLFRHLPVKPQRGSWLHSHVEKGQTFKQFKNFQMKCEPHGPFKTIYIDPIGQHDKSNLVTHLFKLLNEYLSAFFFGLNINVEKWDTKTKFTSRVIQNSTQLNCKDIIDHISKKRQLNRNRSRTELCSIGLTLMDLYPSEDYNFVFGLASPVDGVGCFSLARANPKFFEGVEDLDSLSEKEQILFLRRSISFLTHETCHLFGIKHCIYFSCLMNGCNHLEESDGAPLQLCPICLHKLQSLIGFNEIERYEEMKTVYTKYGFKDDELWIEKRIQECQH